MSIESTYNTLFVEGDSWDSKDIAPEYRDDYRGALKMHLKAHPDDPEVAKRVEEWLADLDGQV